MAAIAAEIAAMPMGYNTLVGNMGMVLSGGQKQSVLLGRIDISFLQATVNFR